ncbi:MAG: DUF4260 family protein, partial [Chloroflexi bacterium]
MPGLLLRIEGLTVLGTAVTLYALSNFSWWTFVLLLLAPDLAMLGYTINKQVGSILYNIFHTYPLPALLILLSFLINAPFALQLGLIWLAHIGMDRIFGYGLKYGT